MMVSAGAGSGKTFLLVKKMADLFCGPDRIAHQAGIEDLLALTFTRKAAGEMRKRVYGELLDRIEQSAEGPARDHVVRVKERFHAARISTIHGFAASLIRSRPVASGTDPDFEILDQTDEVSAIREAVRSTLRNRWNRKDPEIGELLQLWDLFRLRTTLEGLLRRPIEFREVEESHGKEDIIALLRTIQADKFAWFRARLSDPGGHSDRIGVVADHCLTVLDRDGKSRADQKNKEKAQRLLSEFVDPLREFLSGDLPGIVDRAFFDELRKKVKEIGSFRWEGPTAKRILDDLESDTLPWFQPLDRDEAALGWIQGFLNVAGEARERYEEDKRRRGFLVHDELLIKAHDLCQTDSGSVLGSIRHILVDEFQDTDPLQWEMILALAAAAGQKPGDARPQNLFLVGDAKQAIYGFRGADHTVTKTAREALRRSDPTGRTEYVLADNFRSLSAPLEFTNALFERLFNQHGDEQSPYGVPHQPLTQMRDAADGRTGAPSSVVFLVKQAEGEDPWKSEAWAVVRFLSQIRARRKPEFNRIAELMDEGRPAVGILFRAHAPMTHYAGELLRGGLPFSVYHGRTFFQAPEVETLLNLLLWLADPQDEPALVGILRSPLFAWTDEQLALLNGKALGSLEPLAQTAASASMGAGADPLSISHAQRTWRTLNRLRRLSCHLSLSETLRAALDYGMAPLIFSRGPRGDQVDPNIEKFLAMVRELEAAESTTAQTIAGSILERAETAEGEAEAESPLEERSAIQLMTIHAAKGLEFPLIIPACCGKSSGGGASIFSKRITLPDPKEERELRRLTLCGMDFPDPSREMAPAPTILKALLEEHNRMQTSAEEKRLLYVALTRARDHLVIPISLNEETIVAKKGSHLEMLLEAAPELEAAILDGGTEATLGEAAVTIVREEAPEVEAPPVPEFDVDEQVGDILQAEFPAPSPDPQIGEMPYPRRMRLSVTEIMTFSKCPRRFYFEKFLPGYRRSEGRLDSEGDREEPGAGARQVGTLVHKILEEHEDSVRQWEDATDPPREIVRALNRAVLSESSDTDANRQELFSAGLEHLRNLAKSGVLGPRAAGGDSERLTVLREIPFEIEEAGFIIAGAIDRIARSVDGAWSLWDYKTTSLDGRSREEVVREEAYDIQARFYAWAANSILDAPVSSAGIVFTESSEDPFFPVAVDRRTVSRTVSDTLTSLSGIVYLGIEAFEPVKHGRTCESCPCGDLGLC